MAHDDTSPETKPTWHEREITQALQRLATARAHLATLEEQADDAVAPTPDPADVARATELEADIAKYAAKASSRFGGSSARAKREASRRELQDLLARCGVDSVEALRAPAAPAVDPTVLEFARRECADAEQAFLEVTSMVIPEAEPEPDEPDAEVIVASESFADDTPDVDLRIEPSAS